MVRVRGGAFTMGSMRFYPEEAPVRVVEVADFWIDRCPVTNDDFSAFVSDTGYTTVAETRPPADAFPGVPEEFLQAGSLVFKAAAGPVDLTNFRNWWTFVPGASWRHPQGPGSSIMGLGKHPVVHIAWHDASAYAAWAGKTLPSEAEWEYASWGGRLGTDYAWGDELEPGGQVFANYWRGRFPYENLAHDGWAYTSPVGTYPGNGFGLSDMIGNVWEWTADVYETEVRARSPCCGAGRTHEQEADPRVIKGGSHLCAENYCRRYRPAARQGQAPDTSTSHIGFRCVVRD